METRNLCPVRPRLTGCMAFAAQDRSADFWMKRHLIVLSAIIADNIESFWRIVACCRCFFGSAPGTTLRRHHIALVKHLLFLFGEQEDLFTLNTRNFYIRHR